MTIKQFTSDPAFRQRHEKFFASPPAPQIADAQRLYELDDGTRSPLEQLAMMRDAERGHDMAPDVAADA